MASRTLFDVLHLTPTATGSEISIAYDTLSKQLGDGSDSKDAKRDELDEAFAVLSDPARRKEYEVLIGIKPSASGASATTTPAAGALLSIRRAFENVVTAAAGAVGNMGTSSSASAHAPTNGDADATAETANPTTAATDPAKPPLPSDVLDAVHLITQHNGIGCDGPPMDPRVQDLQLGWGADGAVARNAACFYRITVPDDRGNFVYCLSTTKGKFKVAVFDASGALLACESSSKCRDRPHTHAGVFFTEFETFSLTVPSSSAASSASSSSSSSAAASAASAASLGAAALLADAAAAASATTGIGSSPSKLLGKLRPFQPSSLSARAGRYLVVVCGDNLFGKTNFHVVACAAPADTSEATLVQTADASLLTMKAELEALTDTYARAKAAFEAAAQQVREQSDKVERLLDNRERAYREYVVTAIAACAPPLSPSRAAIRRTTSAPSVAAAVAPASSSIGGGDATSTASSDPAVLPEGECGVEVVEKSGPAAAVMPAVRAVSSAGGWIATKFAVGVSQLQQQLSKSRGGSGNGRGGDAAGSEQENPGGGVGEQVPVPVPASPEPSKPSWPSASPEADLSTDSISVAAQEPTFVAPLTAPAPAPAPAPVSAPAPVPAAAPPLPADAAPETASSSSAAIDGDAKLSP